MTLEGPTQSMLIWSWKYIACLGGSDATQASRFWTLVHTAIYAKLSYGDARLDEGCPHPWTQGGMAASNAQPAFCMHLKSFETVPIYADYRLQAGQVGMQMETRRGTM